jgi:hypothetical protein
MLRSSKWSLLFRFSSLHNLGYWNWVW